MALRSCLCRALSLASLAHSARTFNTTLPTFPLLRFPTTFSESNTSLPGVVALVVLYSVCGVWSSGCSVNPFLTTSMRAYATGNKKSGSAAKRARQSEERRIRNKSRKSLIKTRLKKVFRALDELKVSSSPLPEDINPIDTLISKAQSAIDKAVKCGTLHKNTGARKKARLARRKTAVKIHLGLNKTETASGI